MEGTYTREFQMPGGGVSALLQMVQNAAGDHSALLGTDRDSLQEKGLFWAVIRHRLKIHRMPGEGEAVTVTTWPMPTTRSAYPRATEGRDPEGNLLFRAVSLWVLMDVSTRAMVLPKRSGVEVTGVTLGEELEFPGSLGPIETPNRVSRRVCREDLDINGHVNNCRYLAWVAQLPAEGVACPGELTVCYLSEALEGETVTLGWVTEGEKLRIEAIRQGQELSAGHSRVFAAELHK